jgi:hypothetical protein
VNYCLEDGKGRKGEGEGREKTICLDRATGFAWLARFSKALSDDVGCNKYELCTCARWYGVGTMFSLDG